MTDQKRVEFQPGVKVRIHKDSLRLLAGKVPIHPMLIIGTEIRFAKPGFVAFRKGLHGGPEWWSDSHFLSA